MSRGTAVMVISFFVEPPSTEFSTLSLHAALPIFAHVKDLGFSAAKLRVRSMEIVDDVDQVRRSEEHTSELSHRCTSYAVFCLKKKRNKRAAKMATRPPSTGSASAGTGRTACSAPA